MNTRLLRWAGVLVLLSALGGCPAPLEQSNESDLDAPVATTTQQPTGANMIGQSSIPEGIYVGTYTYHQTLRFNLAVIDDTTITGAETETFTTNGLPLVEPVGIEARPGVETDYDFAGSLMHMRIESVFASGSRLTINYSVTAQSADGINYAGTGATTYNYIAPDVLEMLDSMSLVSESVEGNVAMLLMEGFATLGR